MKKEKLFTAGNVLLALVCTLFIISFAVVFTLNFRPLYYADITALDIPAISGLAPGEIRANYDALISYNSIFYTGPLQLPTLAMSVPGGIHFEEVKNIFLVVQTLLGVSFAVVCIGVFLKLRRKQVAFLKLTAIAAVAIPAVLGGLIALNWQMFFVGFHKLFFNNDYWIFDPRFDPVITILPDTFFMHCAILILVLVVAGSLLCYVVYRLLKRRWQQQ
ncbi:TIGR01906 family membrane protein [Ruminococcaceae bacterium OttesenSCG-928-A16]|nr:TIGR01906 family membrane protein [Ruminococcaceae bacterium OttesenSCG-928-A16]